jgi:hypothetical protein
MTGRWLHVDNIILIPTLKKIVPDGQTDGDIKPGETG